MMFRPLLSICLALMLVVTSQAMAVARGSPEAAGQMVLCIGAEAVTVFVDAEGAPIAAPHYCPDCTLNALGPGVFSRDPAPCALGPAPAVRAGAAQVTSWPLSLEAVPRGPPVFV